MTGPGLGRVLLDSAVFIYAVGVEHPYQQPCRDLLAALAAERLQGAASLIAVDEVLHQRARRTGDRRSAARVARSMIDLCPLHELTTADVATGLSLFERVSRLHARDCLHAATALNREIPAIVSPDRAFDDVPGLRRIDPIEAAAAL